MDKYLVVFSLLFFSFSCMENEKKNNPFERVLVFGNSITIHAPDLSIGWYGNRGMAASSANSDFIHVLAAKMNSSIKPVNISNWEIDHASFNLSNLDIHFAGKTDLIIIRLGENVKELIDFKNSFSTLINYIQSSNPEAKLIITGTFWKNDAVNNIMQSVAEEKGLPFVPLSQLDKAENKSFIGAILFGEDGEPHKVIHEGVAEHPNDSGMEQIASSLYLIITEHFMR